MALTEKDTYQVEVTEADHVQVRRRTTIYRDGTEISSTLHRHVVAPGQDYTIFRDPGSSTLKNSAHEEQIRSFPVTL